MCYDSDGTIGDYTTLYCLERAAQLIPKRGVRMKRLRCKQAQRKIVLVLILVVAIGGLFTAYKYLVSNPPFRLLLGAYDFLCTYYIETLDLVMDVSLAEQTIDCTATLGIRPEENSRGYLAFVLADNFSIESALLNGTPAKVWRLWLLNIMRIPKGQRHKPLILDLTYRGQPQSTFLSIDAGFMSERGAALLTNDLWLPHMTRTVPGDVYSTYQICIPERFRIATGGSLVDTISANGKTVEHWENTNLASILIEPFTVTAHKGSKDFHIFTPQAYAHLGQNIAQLADEIVQSYEIRLGTTEPHNINIVFSEGSFSGFYIGGLITIPKSRLERFAAVIDLPDSSAYEDFYHLLTHELGHMWWQNAGDNASEFIGIQWFSEGITEFASLWLTGEKLGRDVYIKRLNRGVDRIRREQSLRPIDQYAYWEHSPIPYYKGSMMLESLRLQQGIDQVFAFLTLMSKLPKGPKTASMAAETAQKAFGKDYSTFFKHWISGVEPLELRVLAYESEGQQGQLTVLSNRACEMPLEIAILYRDRADYEYFPLKKGENKYVLNLKPGAAEIVLDPHRRLFRLADFDSKLAVALEQQHQTVETAQRAVTGTDYIIYDELTPVEEILGLTKDWVPIRKQIKTQGYTASLDYFLPNQRGPWGLITVEWDEIPAYYLDAILWSQRREHLKVRGQIRASSVDFANHESKFLVKWEQYRFPDEALRESDWRLGFAYGAEDFLEFRAGLPKATAQPPLRFTNGDRVEIEEFRVQVDELSFDGLDSILKISIAGKNEWLPVDLLSYDVFLPDGMIIPNTSLSRSTFGDEIEFEIALPLIASRPIPLGINLNGLSFKKKDSPLISYHPGGTLYIGLSEPEMKWDRANLKTIQLGKSTLHLEIFGPLSNSTIVPVLTAAGEDSLAFSLTVVNEEEDSRRMHIDLWPGHDRPVFLDSEQNRLIPILDTVIEPGAEVCATLDALAPLGAGWYSLVAGTDEFASTLGRIFLFHEGEFRAAEQEARQQLEEWLKLLPLDDTRAEQRLLELCGEIPFWYNTLPPMEEGKVLMGDVTYGLAGLNPKPCFIYSLVFQTKEHGDYYCTLPILSDYPVRP